MAVSSSNRSQTPANSMTWEYRVMSRDGAVAIYEVYYYEDGRVRGHSAEPAVKRPGFRGGRLV